MPPAAPDGGAVDRALAEAGTVSGAYVRSPCRFRRLGPAAEALVQPLRAGGAWVLVTVSGSRGSAEDGHRVHLRERCLTAVQRFMLALSCEGVDNCWVDAALPTPAAFRAAGLDLGADVPVGLVWCAEG
ncbi:hypothetical protein [Rubrivirga sp. IMCC45206]|uniref:hypothetical protein n=1 Tax=Rubrivirga sp. IMCC45206 TaxID=3391614 RepID=UPI00398FFD7F